MKLNAKLLIIAFILAIFSVGAVAAAENVSQDSSDLTQVPHEQVVSVSEPTVPENKDDSGIQLETAPSIAPEEHDRTEEAPETAPNISATEETDDEYETAPPILEEF